MGFRPVPDSFWEDFCVADGRDNVELLQTFSSLLFLRFSGPPRWRSSEPPWRLAGPDPGNLKNDRLEKVLERIDTVATIGDAKICQKGIWHGSKSRFVDHVLENGLDRIPWIPRKTWKILGSPRSGFSPDDPKKT